MQASETIVATYIRQDRGQKTHHILVDDTLANLRTAKNMGFKTVWMREYLNKRQVHAKQVATRPRYVDFMVLTIKELIKVSRKIC